MLSPSSSSFTTEELLSEEWRPVKGFYYIYEVSDLGRVRYVDSGQGRIKGYITDGISQSKGRDDEYLGIQLCDKSRGLRVHEYIHRLVTDAFLMPMYRHDEVNHVDKNPRNNRLNNLERCTRWYNEYHKNDNLEAIEKYYYSGRSSYHIDADSNYISPMGSYVYSFYKFISGNKVTRRGDNLTELIELIVSETPDGEVKPTHGNMLKVHKDECTRKSCAGWMKL